MAPVSKTIPPLLSDKIEVAYDNNSITPSVVAVPFSYYIQLMTEVFCLIFADLLSLSLSFYIALEIRLQLMPLVLQLVATPPGFSKHYWWLAVLSIGALAYEGLYNRRLPFWRECGAVCRALTLGIVLILAIISLGKFSSEVSRATLLISYTIAVVLVPFVRYLSKPVLYRFKMWQRRVLIFGAGKTGRIIAKALINDRYRGYTVCGFLDDDPLKQKTAVLIDGINLPVFGGFCDSDKAISCARVYNLVVAAPKMPANELVNLVNKLHLRTPSVVVVPDLFGIPVVGAEADYLYQEKTLVFRVKNNLANPFNCFVKRIFDLVIGGVIFVLLTPALIVLATAIKLDSPGPVVFRDFRIGRRGKNFTCFKFRTMHLNNGEILRKHLACNPDAAEEWHLYAKLKGYDPRVTRVGRFLRHFSLDEFPQLLNVLRGDMSLTGPRPYLPRERDDIGYLAENILIARPGITGLWQVTGRNELTFEDRVQLESWYVHNWSLWMDITLLLRTFGAVLARRGAY
ncbi:MAG: undecaprenyl-phosphate galactose phosphotransferase WbaP [Bacillota bacterium]